MFLRNKFFNRQQATASGGQRSRGKRQQLQKLVSLFFAVLLSLLSYATLTVAQGQNLPIAAKVNLNGQVIELEVALTPSQQTLGLMYRQNLPDNRGMLFVFEPPTITSFWMKNVIIPLDMIFLYKGEIKFIQVNAPPCDQKPCPTYGSNQTLIDQVIELRGGRTQELGIKVGDFITVEFL